MCAADPQAARGSFFPSILEPRRRIDQALYAVVMEAYVHGVSTRSVDDLVAALGRDRDLQVRGVADLRRPGRGGRRVPHPQPGPRRPSRTCTWTRPTCTCATEHAQVVSKAVVVATGVTADGPPRDPRPGRRRQRGRGVLARLPDLAEEPRPGRGAAGHLRPARRPGRRDRAAASKAPRINAAGSTSPATCSPIVPKSQPDMVAALFRTIFAQPDAETRVAPGTRSATSSPPASPRSAPLMDDAKTEVLAFTAFPRAHWRKIWSTNPLERVNKEIKRRARVVGIFPNEAAVIRLVGAVLADIHDEWTVDDRRYLSEGSMAKLHPDRDTDTVAAIDRQRRRHRDHLKAHHSAGLLLTLPRWLSGRSVASVVVASAPSSTDGLGAPGRPCRGGRRWSASELRPDAEFRALLLCRRPRTVWRCERR